MLDSLFLWPPLSSCSVLSGSSTGAVYCFMNEMFVNLSECQSVVISFMLRSLLLPMESMEMLLLVIVVKVDTSHSGIDEDRV